MLAASITGGGTAGVYVPVHDLLGSTLALVNSANAIATQYAYDPFGNSVVSGQNLAYPYQFAGLELDATGLYFNGVGYYDPAFGRSLDGAGVPAAPGSGGMGAAAGLPSGGGGGLGGYSAYLANGTAQEAIATAAGLAAYEAANSMSGAAFSEFALTAYIGSNGGEIGMAVAAVAIIVEEVLDAFGIDLFGGGASRPRPPPMDYRFGHYPPGPFIGVLPALVPDMQDSAAVEAAAMFATAAPPVESDNVHFVEYTIPFKRLPLDPNESPGEGWIRNGRNWVNPDTKQSLSPDFGHQPPKGPHYDLHNRSPRWKLSIRPTPDGRTLQFWDQDLMEWLPLELLPE